MLLRDRLIPLRGLVGGRGVQVRSRTPEGVELIPGSAPEALAEIDLLLQGRP